MDLVYRDYAPSTAAVSSLMRHVVETSPVCAKVIDRHGRVVAVNRRGLDLLGINGDDICDRHWADMWSGTMKDVVAAAVERAFGGEPTSFRGPFRETDPDAVWDVSLFPLEWSGDRVETLVAVSVNLANVLKARDEREASEDLRTALHALGNLAAVGQSCARLLRRSSEDPAVLEIAEGLLAATEEARRTIASIRGPDEGSARQ